MKNLEDFKQLLRTPKKAVIVTHFKPDADALGSSLGLWGYLKKLNHQVTVVTPSDYPDFLCWMPGNSEVVIFHRDRPAAVDALMKNAELIFCLDFNSLKRIDGVGEMVLQSPAIKVLIDHHLEPERFAQFEKSDITAASTAELVFELISELGDAHLIDANIAECLYAGIMTDTGSFRHPNTTHKVFQIAGELVGKGADPSKISKLIYDNNSFERLKLLGFVLSEKLQVIPELRTAYMTLNAEELRKYGSQTGDTEGLVNYGLSIKGIKLSVLISDRKDNIKLSFRSLGNFSVNEFARKYFEGGGHKNAAGGQTNLTLEQTLTKLLELLPHHKNELLND